MRLLQPLEKPLIIFLLEKASIVIELDKIRVISMNDGGMGSLEFCTSHAQNRRFGKVASECSFQDEDNQEVFAALNLDQNGEIFELDVFKSNFSPLLRWPTQQELQKRTTGNQY